MGQLQAYGIGNLFLIELVWGGCNYYLMSDRRLIAYFSVAPEKTEERCR